MADRNQLSINDITGATLIRFETADGGARNIDNEEANRIGFGDVKFRALPGGVTGDMMEPFLYHVLRLDPHRFVFDLPSSMRGTGSTRSGNRAGLDQEGFVFRRGADGKADGRPVGKVIFMNHDRQFREGDPGDRRDFERMG